MRLAFSNLNARLLAAWVRSAANRHHAVACIRRQGPLELLEELPG
ncbi:hypothetical protein PSYJA_32071, partial [Pseudomonas syringae pv. japonica str. M301072]